MNLGQLYEYIVKKGITKDPRGKKDLKNIFKNGYSDTAILYGNKELEIRTVMVGIDVGAPEIIVSYLLNKEGHAIDLVLSHHPSGEALARLSQVMDIHISLLKKIGLSQKVASELTKERKEEVTRKWLPVNHERSVDIARLLNIPFMCVHTPADNYVTHYLQRIFDRKKPRKVKDIFNILREIPEYKYAASRGVGPRLVAGKMENSAGRIFVDMTGGTEGTKRAFGRISQAGVGTIVAMHLSEEHFKNAKNEFINIVIAGHIASDTLGLNLILDEVNKKFELDIIPCSGFVRFSRMG